MEDLGAVASQINDAALPPKGTWWVELGGYLVQYSDEVQRQLELAWARGDQVGDGVTPTLKLRVARCFE